jgi:signal transduction histidine kinase
LVVSDNGIGIHPDFLPHVFQPFRQDESNASTGLGLGLGIVKNLVELHGGTVAAESAGVGRGSQFTVTLPCAVPAS